MRARPCVRDLDVRDIVFELNSFLECVCSGKDATYEGSPVMYTGTAYRR